MRDRPFPVIANLCPLHIGVLVMVMAVATGMASRVTPVPSMPAMMAHVCVLRHGRTAV